MCSSIGFSFFNSLNKSIYQRHVSRTVFMVIDAMRTDFIQNQQNASMKYLNKLISDGTACVLNLNVEVPTVTMPRIKVTIFYSFIFFCSGSVAFKLTNLL